MKTSQDKKKQTAFSKAEYRFWYERMMLMRRFEEKSAQLYGRQKIKGFCHLYIGQEACAAGAVSALKKADKYITAYRDHALPIALGTEPKYVMAELFGKKTGTSKGRGGSMHIFDLNKGFFGGHGIVGGQIPLGAGIAFAEKYQKTQHVCITYMGDGAVRQGAFHETMNLAMIYNLPVIFVIENNGYAMGTSVERTSNVTKLYQLGSAYDMPSYEVDGMSVEDVHVAVQKAAQRARIGEGPTLLEMNTYRYKGHSMSDPAQYRTKEELQSYKEKDPIIQLKATILKKDLLGEKEIEEIDQKIKNQVDQAVSFAEESPYPSTEDVYEHVYVEKDYPFVPAD
ncbi:MAG: pyruvate dehydrogenase (acetyl-transferring) E1 component subunit alpha [Cytophagales bacterium]|nr:pyruvate dehydrogenase (acetyl-transferring) E1 component subunit alpha [Cytophagales bacterium]